MDAPRPGTPSAIAPSADATRPGTPSSKTPMPTQTTALTNTQPCSFTKEQLHLVREYIRALGDRDVDGLLGLFAADGMVVSTSAGHKEPKGFFTPFLTGLSSATSELRSIYCQSIPSSSLSVMASFNFTFVEADATEGEGGIYVDVFYFTGNANSPKLKLVEMFENPSLR